MEHGYGMERNGGAAGGRVRQWHIEGRHSDGYKRGSVDVRHSSRGWAGNGVGAKGHGNREVEAEKGRRSNCHPSSALASIALAQS